MMKVKRKSLSLLILVVLILFLVMGCNPIASPNTPEGMSPTQSAQPAESQGVSTPMNPSETPFASSLENLIEQAKADLAQRLSISISDISLVEAKEVTWPDGSLGCPQPGMLYTQVLTPGYLIKLKYDSRDFEYHAGKAGAPTYCENPTLPVEGVPGNT